MEQPKEQLKIIEFIRESDNNYLLSIVNEIGEEETARLILKGLHSLFPSNPEYHMVHESSEDTAVVFLHGLEILYVYTAPKEVIEDWHKAGEKQDLTEYVQDYFMEEEEVNQYEEILLHINSEIANAINEKVGIDEEDCLSISNQLFDIFDKRIGVVLPPEYESKNDDEDCGEPPF